LPNKLNELRAAKHDAELGEVAAAWWLGGRDFLPYRLALLARMLDRLTSRHLKEIANLTAAEWRVLGQLALSESPITVRQISEAAWVDRAEVSRAATNLRQRRLLQRKKNPDDLRSPLFSLTKEGQAMWMRVRHLRRQFLASFTEELSVPQQNALDEALHILAKRCVKDLAASRSSTAGSEPRALRKRG
jgi:DNA-binding MarR family transcriptional regulator